MIRSSTVLINVSAHMSLSIEKQLTSLVLVLVGLCCASGPLQTALEQMSRPRLDFAAGVEHTFEEE